MEYISQNINGRDTKLENKYETIIAKIKKDNKRK